MNILGVIPARYASTRFPGKPLTDISGKSMIRRVYEQAGKTKALSRTVVATDDERIYKHVKAFGGEVFMTSEKHENGTARCYEVLTKIENAEQFHVVINIQGDEPFIEPAQIDAVSNLFNQDEIEIGTLVKKIDSSKELFDPNIVKVVFSNQKKALYFSRQPIPFLRDVEENMWVERWNYYKHIGIYGYRVKPLNEIVKLKTGKLEVAEKLEQLRWLEEGYQISVDTTDFESIAIDTPEDLLKIYNKH